MELLLLLILGHIIADFYIQRFVWIECRNNNHFRSKGLLLHVASHFLITLPILLLTGQFSLSGVFVVLGIVVSHYLIDVWKSYQDERLRYFLIDQGLHVLILIAGWALLAQFSLEQSSTHFAGTVNVGILSVLCAYLIVGRPTSFAISIALSKYPSTKVENTFNRMGMLLEGRLVGYLERYLIVTFILVEFYLGIGVLIVAKAIFHFAYQEKSNVRKVTQHKLFGTVISLATALLIGWGTLVLII